MRSSSSGEKSADSPAPSARDAHLSRDLSPLPDNTKVPLAGVADRPQRLLVGGTVMSGDRLLNAIELRHCRALGNHASFPYAASASGRKRSDRR